MSQHSRIILGIESAISGGSLSLVRDGVEIANWIGSANISKAEDLLANIDTLLVDNGLSAKDIDLVAVSAGPGSFTGIRIGLATALGLKTGLGVEMSSESSLKAIVSANRDIDNVIAAIPMGRDSVCSQMFSRVDGKIMPLDEPQTGLEQNFAIKMKNERTATFLIHGDLYERIGVSSSHVINSGRNIALAIAHICGSSPGKIVEPLFISKSF